MKIRDGFISNSSSTSFVITNTTSENKTLVDFVEENPQLVEMFNEQHGYKYTQEQMLDSAGDLCINFQPKESQACAFGDEDETAIGHVFDYILRGGGRSESFKWKFKEYNR